jgi:hypothetical protein
VRPGLYQCIERQCRSQFTVTTRMPLHATKLDLRTWIAAMFLVLTSSKGISSVVMSRILGVNQKTAWKLGHAIREMMDDRQGIAGRLSGVVEVDEAFVGGKPKFCHGVKNKRGRGTGKPIALVAAARNGQARAVLIPNTQGRTMKPISGSITRSMRGRSAGRLPRLRRAARRGRLSDGACVSCFFSASATAVSRSSKASCRSSSLSFSDRLP